MCRLPGQISARPASKQIARLRFFHFDGGRFIEALREHLGEAFRHVLHDAEGSPENPPAAAKKDTAARSDRRWKRQWQRRAKAIAGMLTNGRDSLRLVEGIVMIILGAPDAAATLILSASSAAI